MYPKYANFVKKFRLDLLVIIFFLLFSPLFFYNLGGTSLIDFDEAWYAEIARNILTNKQPLLLSFNDLPYRDHPPLGFILMAISFLVFGINEFAARFPSAILGLSSIIVLYLIGRDLFNKTVGIGAGLMLLSSVWFVMRARSANLDLILLFFYLLTFYCAIKLFNNYKWIFPLSVSIALLLLSKSIVGLSILAPITPVIIYTFTKSKKSAIKNTVLATVLFLIILLPWIILSIRAYGSGFIDHILSIGFRPDYRMIPNIREIYSSLTFVYLHFGIREWFYPGLIALIGSVFFIIKKPIIILFYLWFLTLLFAFLTNSKTEIWHLIPLYPILGLMISFFLYYAIDYLLNFLLKKRLIFSRYIANYAQKKFAIILSILVLLPLLLLSLKQIYEFRDELSFFKKELSGLSVTANSAKDLPQKLFLDNEFFLPGPVFYSQKKVYLVKGESPPKNSLKGIITYGEKPFLLLTEQWRLDTDKIDNSKYQLLSQHQGYVLIKVVEH